MANDAVALSYAFCKNCGGGLRQADGQWTHLRKSSVCEFIHPYVVTPDEPEV